MLIKVITIASDPNYPGLQKLKSTLEKHGFEYEVMIVPFQFGRQMKTIYKWCQDNTDRSFLYTDAYDTVALGSYIELIEKIALTFTPMIEMLVSAEKACYPNPSLAEQYPASITEWKYVNGGGFCTSTDFFKKMYEDGSHHDESNDQEWLSLQFLKRPEIVMDYECKIFQSIAFEGIGDFTYKEGRLINNFTNQKPIFPHGNGHTSMEKIYSLL